MEHLMIDLETMAKGSKSAVVSIALVEFDLDTGVRGSHWKRNIDLQSCIDACLKVDGDTIMWWMAQSDEARQSILSDTLPLAEALLEVTNFIKSLHPQIQVWGNGAKFDLGILTDAFEAVKLPLPWIHWNERDVRTLVSFAPHIKKEMPFDGVKHNAIHDCIHQIKYCSAIYHSINPKTPDKLEYRVKTR